MTKVKWVFLFARISSARVRSETMGKTMCSAVQWEPLLSILLSFVSSRLFSDWKSGENSQKSQFFRNFFLIGNAILRQFLNLFQRILLKITHSIGKFILKNLKSSHFSYEMDMWGDVTSFYEILWRHIWIKPEMTSFP